MARVTAILIGLAGLLLPVGMVLSHRNVPVVLVLIALAGLAALKDFRPRPWMTAVYALLVWAVMTTLWSPYGDAASWTAYLLLLGLFGTAAMLAGGAREGRWMSISVLVCLALLFIESVSGGIIRDIVPPEGRPDKDDVATARGITVLLCLLPGFLLFFWKALPETAPLRGWAMPGFLLLAGVCAASFGIAANLMAFFAALGAAGVVWLLPKWGLRLVIAGAILPLLVMPLVAMALPPIEQLALMEEGPVSWRQRLIAWKAVWTGMTEGVPAFLFGHGVEGARIVGERLGQMPIPGAVGEHNAIPTHPHNVYLQVWIDLGFIGAGLAFVSMLMAARAFLGARLPRLVLMAVAALVAMVAVFALFDASLWTLWRVAGPLLGAWLILVTGRAYRGEGAA